MTLSQWVTQQCMVDVLNLLHKYHYICSTKKTFSKGFLEASASELKKCFLVTYLRLLILNNSLDIGTIILSLRD